MATNRSLRLKCLVESGYRSVRSIQVEFWSRLLGCRISEERDAASRSPLLCSMQQSHAKCLSAALCTFEGGAAVCLTSVSRTDVELSAFFAVTPPSCLVPTAHNDCDDALLSTYQCSVASGKTHEYTAYSQSSSTRRQWAQAGRSSVHLRLRALQLVQPFLERFFTPGTSY